MKKVTAEQIIFRKPKHIRGYLDIENHVFVTKDGEKHAVRRAKCHGDYVFDVGVETYFIDLDHQSGYGRW